LVPEIVTAVPPDVGPELGDAPLMIGAGLAAGTDAMFML
jgi:hypothetical protein